MTKTIEQKRADRFLFLKAAYEVTENKSPRFFNVWEIGDSLGFSREESRSIFEYLSGEYLVKPKFSGGGYLVTHAGVVEVEEALSNPDQATEHFPPISLIVNTGTMITQTIQGNQNVVSLSNSLSITALGSYIELLEELRKEVASITAEVETQTLFHRRIDEALAELRKPTPDIPVIRSLVGGIKTLLTFAGGAIAEGWLQKLLGLN